MKVSLITRSLLMTLVTASLVVLTACSQQSRNFLPPDAPTVADLGEYRIGVGDELNVSVWRNEDLSITVPVRPDGKISVALVGDVVAAGVRPEDLAKTLADELENYVRSPQVTVIVSSSVSAQFESRIRITGAVGSPSSFPYRKGMTVMDVVLSVGGVTQFADADNAKLYRRQGEQVQVYDVDLDAILKQGDLRTNYYLLPTDIITVPERLF